MNESNQVATRRSFRIAPLSALLIAGAAFGALALRPVTEAPQSLVMEESPIHEHMEVMNGAMRFFLKTGVTAENRDKALEWAQKFQNAVVAAKGFAPSPVGELDAEHKAQFDLGYRKTMVDVLAASCRLELAILDGKYEEATRVAREELGKLKKQGHDTYTKEEEEHERGRGGERGGRGGERGGERKQ